MRVTRAALLPCLAVVLLLPAFAQESVGRIVSIDGHGEIDAFGTNRFIAAEPGDALYGSTVLRTDYASWMTMSIGEQTFEIAPGSTTRVSTFASDRRRQAAGLLPRLLRSIVDSLAPPKEDRADFGGRARPMPSSESIELLFVTDVDADQEFASGRLALERTDYRSAADHLRRIEFPEDGTFGLVEYYIALGHALLGLGDFDAAMRAAFEYVGEEPSEGSPEALPARLRLIVAIGAYYGGDDELAARASESCVDELGLDKADPVAIAIHVTLVERTDPGRAEILERAVRESRPSVDWDLLLGS